jgi:hypothetical protein
LVKVPGVTIKPHEFSSFDIAPACGGFGADGLYGGPIAMGANRCHQRLVQLGFFGALARVAVSNYGAGESRPAAMGTASGLFFGDPFALRRHVGGAGL